MIHFRMANISSLFIMQINLFLGFKVIRPTPAKGYKKCGRILQLLSLSLKVTDFSLTILDISDHDLQIVCRSGLIITFEKIQG